MKVEFKTVVHRTEQRDISDVAWEKNIVTVDIYVAWDRHGRAWEYDDGGWSRARELDAPSEAEVIFE